VFSWAPPKRFDVIFFAFWLSHVPASRFKQFWRLLQALLADHGRVLFVDEHADVQGKETYAEDSNEIIERQLRDGSVYRLVKAFVQPSQLRDRLRQLGWQCHIRRDDADWVVGEARPVQ
jgi:demethylmenaquinone methyltransferase/2-methoxy-6-polyprenyl-1,4-benzoquinol methylase